MLLVQLVALLLDGSSLFQWRLHWCTEGGREEEEEREEGEEEKEEGRGREGGKEGQRGGRWKRANPGKEGEKGGVVICWS